MARDLIIGGASNYTWDHLKYWVNSIRRSGFDGDVAIVGTNMTRETIEKLTSEGIILSLYGKTTEYGDVVAHSKSAPHVERFFYLWNFMNSLKLSDYRYAITTDTRDVVFQRDPSQWIEKFLSNTSFIISSEGLSYKDEPWGNQNLLETFGPFFHEKFKEATIYNVGVLAGKFSFVRDLMLMIFQMSVNRPIPVVDQAVFNFLLNLDPFATNALYTDNKDDWAVQLGTTLEAVKSGKGDLGRIFQDDPDRYLSMYKDSQPKIDEFGILRNPLGDKYVIVHQWDRVPELAEHFEKLYGDD